VAQLKFRLVAFTIAQNAKRRMISGLVSKCPNGVALAIARRCETALQGFDVACTPLFAPCGAMAATITPSQGTVDDVWAAWLDNYAILIDADAELAVSLGHTVGVQDGAPEILSGPHQQLTICD